MSKLSKYPILLFLYCAAALFTLYYCKNDKQQPVYEDLGSVKTGLSKPILILKNRSMN